MALCYGVWALGTTWAAALWLPLGIGLTALAVALHSSLQHEAIHGHPTPWPRVNAVLMAPGLTLLVPYLRFRDTHLDHHDNAVLTDPYDDPESNYMDPAVWGRLPRPVQALLVVNNTLLGRVTVGTAIGLVAFLLGEARLARQGDARVIRGWLWHGPALLPVAGWLAFVAQMPVWGYLLAAYGGMSLVRIRTFLEHQAAERASARTAIIEDRGPLAWLFLNNNLHVVHHMHPKVPWYRLPELYEGNRDRYVRRNGGYVYRSYAEIFRRYLLRPKDPVPHPLWGRRG
ncbi:fatty acid desaturase [Psychromarinibacter sp. C21-152]|uniref:Fatty acid desaturase n=1 Tax=Psychromarinibacter sediminicola TaxID=3033385 RepID=A0AAE3NJV3_9RHOB|nr:fatty acid desaturase [Psychromarinibacter sediminicola]MDF0599163.1 fatty acid desaturase [Psychromarinibacter sediminicola]